MGRRVGVRAAAVAVSTLLVLAGAAGCATDSDDGSRTTEDGPATSTSGAPTTSESLTTSTAPTTTAVPATTAPPAPPEPVEPVDPTTVPEEGPLQSGSVGSRTKALQESLKTMGYDPGPIDGKFGLRTTHAVWAFQALHGLAKDGVVGEWTEAAILDQPEQEMLRPEHGPTHTEVDLTRQVMLVWRDGAPALITHVSTGSQVAYCETTDAGRSCGDAVTPTGVYRYERRIDGWRVAPLGRLYNPVYFVGGIAVHGAPSVPNHPASHGCVRIPMAIAEYFPSLVANGDVIDVFRS